MTAIDHRFHMEQISEPDATAHDQSAAYEAADTAPCARQADTNQQPIHPALSDSALRTPHSALADPALSDSALRTPHSALADPALSNSALRTPHSALADPALSNSALRTPHSALAEPSLIPSPFSSLASVRIQPISDVRAYLKTRKPVLDFNDELPLFNRLTDDLRAEVESLFAACTLAQALVNGRLSVSKSCARAFAIFSPCLSGSVVTFRAKYDLWAKSKDWFTLVNLSKAGAEWQQTDVGLPDEFLTFCASRFGEYKGRTDIKSEALRSILRQWQTGRDRRGNPAPIPGYGFWQDWYRKTNRNSPLRTPHSALPEEAPIPEGWHRSNIMRQIKARNVYPASVEALLSHGTAEATRYLPQVRTTRNGRTGPVRFMEQIQFDDLKTDFSVFDPVTGQSMDLWLLIAHDVATGLLLGFGMRPARAREDGSQEHLKLRDMKQLLGWLFERFGLPPYTVHFKFERGTATVSQGTAAAILELLGGRVQCHFSSMHGGKSPAGYAEKKTGNSRAKGSLESSNRLNHIIGADLEGQTGPHYSRRPSDLAARQKECAETWKLAQALPDHLRSQIGYSLLTLAQAREQLVRIFGIRNHRTDHHMEGFQEILEWFDPATGKMQPQNTAPHPLPAGAYINNRKESPVERAARLSQGFQWTPISPHIIKTLYEHTERLVVVNEKSQIVMQHEGNLITFVNPTGAVGRAVPCAPETKLLAYYHPDDPAFLHLTNGKGAIIGTWLRQTLVDDQESLSQAIRHNTTALNAARAYADELAAPERERLEQMRARNAELLQMNDFTEVANIPHSALPTLHSGVAAAFTTTRAQIKARAKADQQSAADARANLMSL